MKKFILMPLLFFKISTCIKFPNINFKAIFGTTSSNHRSERLNSLRSQAYNLSPAQTIPTTPNESIKSSSDGFKEIKPVPNIYVTQIEMRNAQNAQQNEINKIRIQDAIISGALFSLSKIDYSWLCQTIKNFFNPKEQLNEA